MDTKHFGTELFKSSLVGSKVLSCSACCSHSRKAKYNEVEENRAELVTPVLPFCFKVPVVPLAYLRPVNLTQPSSREDLGSNKGLTPRSPGLRPHWRRWLASAQPSASRLLTPSLPLPCLSLSFPSFTVVPLCLCILFFFAPFVPLFLTFSLLFSYLHYFSPSLFPSFFLSELFSWPLSLQCFSYFVLLFTFLPLLVFPLFSCLHLFHVF